MPERPFDLDLKLTPSWLKEEPSKDRYADFEGEPPERGGRGGRRPARPDRRSSDRGDRPPRGRDRGRRPPRPEHADPRREHKAPAEPAPVRVELIPEPASVAAMAQQIRTSMRAYPLFGMARMFLMKPEHHRVRITAQEGKGPLFQAGADGPVSLDRELLAKLAFRNAKDRYFVEETVERESPKGNFTNVARCRLSGTLLGPTNHHAYQQSLRRLYEQRFSRRMPFADYQREIEIVRDPAAVEAWKEQMRTSRVFRLRENPETTFETVAQAEQYFGTHFLEAELRSGESFEIPGDVSRELADRSMLAAVREAWERERGFPASIVHHIRKAFLESGLHLFKHRKRMQFISAVRPESFPPESKGTLSPGIAGILDLIAATPDCSRKKLADAALAKIGSAADAKAALASDLHWLIHSGHVIEFHDGKLDLPFVKPKEEKPPAAEATPETPPPTTQPPQPEQ